MEDQRLEDVWGAYDVDGSRLPKPPTAVAERFLLQIITSQTAAKYAEWKRDLVSDPKLRESHSQDAAAAERLALYCTLHYVYACVEALRKAKYEDVHLTITFHMREKDRGMFQPTPSDEQYQSAMAQERKGLEAHILYDLPDEAMCAFRVELRRITSHESTMVRVAHMSDLWLLLHRIRCYAVGRSVAADAL